MKVTITCHNCGGDKSDNIYAPWCTKCLEAVQTAREAAEKANEDPGQAQRSALWQRSHNPHRGRADSRTQIQRTQFDDFVSRINVKPGSADDPTRGR